MSEQLKLHNSDEMETIRFRLDKELHPIAWEKYVNHHVQELDMTRDQAEYYLRTFEIQLELYFEPETGAFMAIEPEMTTGDIYSPYTGEKYQEMDQEPF